MSAPVGSPAAARRTPCVLLAWKDVAAEASSPELLAALHAAFSYDGLGILAVSGVPGLVGARAAALPQAHAFGSLPPAVQARYVDAASTYSFGWSHGLERLEGKPDVGKGSYYNNPVHDSFEGDATMAAQHPALRGPNVWPSDADAPGFTAAYKALARVMVAAAEALARHIDAYVAGLDARYPASPELSLAAIVARCRTHKARLLYYFPAPAGAAGGDVSVSSSCGWHNDHSNLTALCPAMYWARDGAPIACPDPDAGLYVRARDGGLHQLLIPPDALAFQIGETAQVHSGGILQATPHCVRAAAAEGVSRGTMAVFFGPEHTHPMACPGLQPGDAPPAVAPPGSPWERVLRGARGELLPPGVPPLAARWQGPSQTFGEFTARTLAAYY